MRSFYPRPQLQRTNWTSLDGKWRFCFDESSSFREPSDVLNWTHEITVPFAPESPLSGIGDTGFHKDCWYQREIAEGFVLQNEKRLILHFGAVDYKARIWINNTFVGEHCGGHTPFKFDISHLIKKGGGPYYLTVHAEDDPFDLAKPRGKQDWKLEPHSIWYPRTSGIWQTVWLEEVSATYIERLRWTPHLERWEIGFEAFIAGKKAHEIKSDMKVELTLQVGEQILVHDLYQVVAGEVHRRIALSDPGIDDFRNELLWSPEKPTLIEASIKLWKGNQLLDEVNSYTALRSVSLSRDRFMLNGRPYYLRMVLDQGYWRESLMTPPSDEAIQKDIRLTKEMGFNGVRKHQKIEDPRFFYWADRMGLLVWEEMPSCYRFTHESVERLTQEWVEVLDRDMNHPSIVTWVPFNESWGVPDLAEKVAHQNCVRALYYLTKTLDPSRPVIGNDGWESVATDIIGIHDYDSSPARILQRYEPGVRVEELLWRRRPGGRILALDREHSGPLMLTEFGGIAFAADALDDANKSWGYSRSKTLAEFQYQYEKVGSSRVDLQACKLEYSIVSPK